jgi:hypothetical protein
MAGPDPAFSSVFANFAEELDWPAPDILITVCYNDEITHKKTILSLKL